MTTINPYLVKDKTPHRTRNILQIGVGTGGRRSTVLMKGIWVVNAFGLYRERSVTDPTLGDWIRKGRV